MMIHKSPLGKPKKLFIFINFLFIVIDLLNELKHLSIRGKDTPVVLVRVSGRHVILYVYMYKVK